MSPPQVPDTWYQGAGKKSWCRVMQFLHVDALFRLCSCVTAVLSYPPQCPRLKSCGRGSSNMCGRRGASRFRQAGPPPHTCHGGTSLRLCMGGLWSLAGLACDRGQLCSGWLLRGAWCVCSCVCDQSAAAVCGTFQRFDLREKIQNKTNSLLNRFWSCQARLTLLNRYLLWSNFS